MVNPKKQCKKIKKNLLMTLSSSKIGHNFRKYIGSKIEARKYFFSPKYSSWIQKKRKHFWQFLTSKIHFESTISSIFLSHSLQLLSLGLKQCIAYLLKAKVKKAGSLTNQGKVYVSTRILVKYQTCHVIYVPL